MVVEHYLHRNMAPPLETQPIHQLLLFCQHSASTIAKPTPLEAFIESISRVNFCTQEPVLFAADTATASSKSNLNSDSMIFIAALMGLLICA